MPFWAQPNRGVTYLCFMQATNASANTKSARQGQFQKKEENSDNSIEHFFPEFFSTDINKGMP